MPPTWGETLAQISQIAEANSGQVDLDSLRLDALKRIRSKTQRPVVAYYSAFLTAPPAPSVSIMLQDMQGLMEVFKGLPGPNLDLILHSPGGQAEATESLVRYMRSRYQNVRVLVPMVAMSAATMWAMASDEIVMGNHSQLGPIDPQITLPVTGLQLPAGALVDQFEKAVQECADDPRRVAGWLPTLQQYPPGLLNVCQSATELAQRLVGEWLSQYMLAGDTQRARQVAEWLADDKTHLSHGRALRIEDLQAKGVNVSRLEDDPELQDAVLTYHHLAMHTFGGGTALKIIENNAGARFAMHGIVQQPAVPN